MTAFYYFLVLSNRCLRTPRPLLTPRPPRNWPVKNIDQGMLTSEMCVCRSAGWPPCSNLYPSSLRASQASKRTIYLSPTARWADQTATVISTSDNIALIKCLSQLSLLVLRRLWYRLFWLDQMICRLLLESMVILAAPSFIFLSLYASHNIRIFLLNQNNLIPKSNSILLRLAKILTQTWIELCIPIRRWLVPCDQWSP